MCVFLVSLHFRLTIFHTCPLLPHFLAVFVLQWRGTVASNCKHTYIISLNRFNGFGLETPPVGRPLSRHYIIARQACLRRQISILLLQTEAQGASSATDEPLQHINTQRHCCCQDCYTCSAAQLRQDCNVGDTSGRGSSFALKNET